MTVHFAATFTSNYRDISLPFPLLTHKIIRLIQQLDCDCKNKYFHEISYINLTK